MALMTIGEFAEQTRLSVKALRLYDRLRLVVPAQVDPDSGYRMYSADQVEPARLVGMLRRLDMPLATISSVLALDPADAAKAVASYWSGVESATADRRLLADYLERRLNGADIVSYQIEVRAMPERTLLAINRHVYLADTDEFFGDAFARLRAGGPGVAGIAGVPFLIFYREVSADSDGPIELCRPVAADAGNPAADASSGVERRIEPAHGEAYIRLPKKEVAWPAMLPACDALERWVHDHQRRPAGPLRQLLIADQRTATPDTLTCDLSVPLR